MRFSKVPLLVSQLNRRSGFVKAVWKLSLLASAACAASGLVRAAAGELIIVPPEIRLDGPGSSQQMLAMNREEQELTGTVAVAWQIRDSAIATVVDGNVRPKANGETTLTASTPDGRTAAVTVTVAAFTSRASPSFRNEVQPVLTRNGCNSGACHGAAAGQNGFRLSLRGYDPAFDFASITRQAAGRRINPADPARSLLLTKASGAIAHKGGVRLDTNSNQYRILAAWIAAGQPGPSAADPRISQLEIFPQNVVLPLGAQQPFIVRAWFSDGHVEDVTRQVRFGGTDQTVARVDESGLATVAGHGETSITAAYLGRNCLARIRSPFTTLVSAETLAAAPVANFIDQEVLQKLESLNILPSPPATDTVFLRRAYLDTIGLPPTPSEVTAYLADSDPQKREKLIDRLLSRPEYVDYWAYRWSDLLLVNSGKLPPAAAQAYYDWIRRQVAANTPWNDFAREVVTATGSSASEGVVNFYALHQDPQDMAEAVSMTFLGMAINCARCHDHPLEKWTNDQYFAMANLFARVRSKGPDANRVVFTVDRGDLIQPRTGEPQAPCPLDGEPLELDDPRDRREHLAAWLTSPDNPYFARAVINRVWANFLGVGLVEAIDDVRLTNPPSNEELLAALERDFIAHDYDLKHLMRRILMSETYRRSSIPVSGNEADRRYYSHFFPRRIKAEVLLDALSQATLAATQFAKQPPESRALQLPDVKIDSYFLDTFGRPDREQTCECERSDAPSVKQALHLMNGDTLNEKLARVADRKKKTHENRIGQALAAELSASQIVEQAYLACLCRYPAEDEQAQIVELISATQADQRRQVVEDLYWGLLTSKEFLFQH